jgi:hypothetical protein
VLGVVAGVIAPLIFIPDKLEAGETLGIFNLGATPVAP